MNTAVATELPLEAATSEERPAKQRRKSAEKAHVTDVEAEVMPPATGTAVATVQSITPMQMLQTALEKGADLEQMQQLMDLQDRWEKNEARKAYVVAMAAFKADPPTLMKTKKVSFDSKDGKTTTEYRHATLDNVAGMIGAALSKHGLSHAWKTEQGEGGMIRVTCTITHVLGHSESVWLQSSPDSSGGKNNIQAVGSTVSYLERYTILAITGLATKDQDDDGNAAGEGEAISAVQKDEIVALLAETESDTKAFCALYGIEAVDQLPAAKFNHARALLTKKKGQMKGAAK